MGGCFSWGWVFRAGVCFWKLREECPVFWGWALGGQQGSPDKP